MRYNIYNDSLKATTSRSKASHAGVSSGRDYDLVMEKYGQSRGRGIRRLNRGNAPTSSIVSIPI